MATEALPRRRSARLKGYDYSTAGAYFMTIVTGDRGCRFGSVEDGEMKLSDAGRATVQEWEALSDRFPSIELDEFVVMPNHMHGIIVLNPPHAAAVSGVVGATLVVARARDREGQPRAGTSPAPTDDRSPTLGAVVGAFKSLSTLAYMHGVRTAGWPPFRAPLWQRNYWEHIIRDEPSLDAIRRYIADNPAAWDADRENAGATVRHRLGRPPWEV